MQNLLIRASAGSGKTFQLSNRYIDLAVNGVPLDAVLASTFTKKAAGEILDRILKRLAEAALDDSKLVELAQHISKGKTKEGVSRSEILNILHDAIKSLHRLRVGTLDSFFIRIASSFCLDLGISPGWSIVETQDENRFLSEAVRKVFVNSRTDESVHLMHLLSKGEVARSVTEQALALSRELVQLYRDAPRDAWRKLVKLPTLTQDELREILEEYKDAILPTKKDGTPDTNFLKARDSDIMRAEAEDWDKFLKSGLPPKVVDGTELYYKKPIEGELLTILHKLVSHAKAILINKLSVQTEATGDLLERVVEEYEAIKEENGVLRFDDVTYKLSNSLLGTRLEQIVHRIDTATEHLLLDEFQDTAPMQWEVLRPFALEAIKSINKKAGSFFCVGDVKQAIYGWRGGVAEIFNAIETEIQPLETQGLNKSYRSSLPVIDTVNELFSKLKTNEAFLDAKNPDLAEAAEKWHKRFEKHVTQKSELPGYCTLEIAPRFDPEKDKETGNEYDPSEYENDYANETENGFENGSDTDYEAEINQKQVTLKYAIQRISELHHESPGAEIGVLVRRNQTVSKIINGLKRLGIDASEEGGNPLTDSPAVEMILSVLTFADHPGDSVARFHVKNGPLAGILSENVESISTENILKDDNIAYEDNITKDESITNNDENILNGENVQNENSAETADTKIRKQLLKHGYGEVIGEWIKILAPHYGKRDLERMLQLLTLAYSWDTNAPVRPDRFVDWIRNTRIESPTSAKIRVMTIHQSKGLEFDIVVLPELEDKLIGQSPTVVVGRVDTETGKSSPTGKIDRIIRYTSSELQALLPNKFKQMFSEFRQQRVEESLCLLYVALTRAVHRLVMIIPPRKELKSGKEPAPTKTFEGVLRCGLVKNIDDDKPASISYQCGDKNWAKKCKLDICEQPESGPKLESVEICLKANVSPRRNLPRIIPSQLHGYGLYAGNIRADDLLAGNLYSDKELESLENKVPTRAGSEAILRATSGNLNGPPPELDTPESKSSRNVIAGMDRRTAQIWGSAIHACFEKGFAKNKWLDQEKPTNFKLLEEIVENFKREQRCEVDAKKVVKSFLEICEKPNISAALSVSSYEKVAASAGIRNPEFEVYSERNFMVGYKEGIMRGSIDRLVITSSGGKIVAADVIDFKTDSFDFASQVLENANETAIDEIIEQKKIQYWQQLYSYRKAVEKLYGLPLQQITAKLVFTSIDKVVKIHAPLHQ
ncbi:MAG: UvrD-helicase domain-containing protein [Thermoguttaceae bacterium]